MRKKNVAIVVGVVAAAFALPGIAAASEDRPAEDFVCPVLGANGNTHAQDGLAGAQANGNPNLMQIGGDDWSTIGPEVGNGGVPDRATTDGTPGGAHARPGDSNYTAIWGN